MYLGQWDKICQKYYLFYITNKEVYAPFLKKQCHPSFLNLFHCSSIFRPIKYDLQLGMQKNVVYVPNPQYLLHVLS